MNWIERVFLAGSLDEENVMDPGELGPEDLIAHRLVNAFKLDHKMQQLFGSKIEYMPVRNPLDFRDLPRLQVYPGSTLEVQGPTDLNILDVRIGVGVRFSMDEIKPVTNMHASISTVLWQVKKIMRAKCNRHLTVTVNGTDVRLARQSDPETVSFEIDVQTDGGRADWTQILVWTFSIRSDDPTGQIDNIAIAQGLGG